MGTKYKAQQFIDAIPNSGGIVTTIAERVGCQRNTVSAALKRWTSVKEAYDAECEVTGDMAESIVAGNIKLLYTQQKEGKVVDSADAKWYLTKKRSDVFGDKVRQDLNFLDPLILKVENMKEDVLKRIIDHINS